MLPPKRQGTDCVCTCYKQPISTSFSSVPAPLGSQRPRYSTPKREIPESASRSAGASACKTGGAGHSACTGAGRLCPCGKQKQNRVPAAVPPNTPSSASAPANTFLEFLVLGSLYQVAGVSTASALKCRGPENGAFGKPCFCPARKRRFETKMAKMTNLHSNQ